MANRRIVVTIAASGNATDRARFETMTAISTIARQGGRGFSADVTHAEARRQLRMSICVVSMLVVGIVSAAFTVGAHPVSARRDVTSTAPLAAAHHAATDAAQVRAT